MWASKLNKDTCFIGTNCLPESFSKVYRGLRRTSASFKRFFLIGVLTFFYNSVFVQTAGDYSWKEILQLAIELV